MESNYMAMLWIHNTLFDIYFNLKLIIYCLLIYTYDDLHRISEIILFQEPTKYEPSCQPKDWQVY